MCRNLKLLLMVATASTATLALFAPALRAVPIGGLYDTGVDNSGVPFASPNVADPHYSLIVSPQASTAVTVDDTNYPFPPWLPNTPTARWIGSAADGSGLGGSNFIYRTTFNLPPSALLSSVSLSGLWAVDDVGTGILINGNATGQTTSSNTSLTAFTITSGFVSGINTLDFPIQNLGSALFGSNPTGLIVDRLSGTYQQSPEPGTAPLASIGLLISKAFFVRRRTTSRSEVAMP
jgi:hypothetical protein